MLVVYVIDPFGYLIWGFCISSSQLDSNHD